MTISSRRKKRGSSLHTHMATPKGGGAPPTEEDESVPIARIVSEDGSQAGNNGVAVVVGQRVPAPMIGAYAVATTPTPAAHIPVATAQPSSAYTAPGMHNSTGSWTVSGPTTSGGGHGGGVSGGASSSSSMRGSSGSWGAGGGEGSAAAAADGVYFPVMTHTGTRNVPGCGTASSTGGRRFVEEGAGRGQLARSRSGSRKGGGISLEEDSLYVADGGPVLIACGQGKSMYDVKGCLSSWVLRGGGGGGGGPKDRVKEKLAAIGGAAPGRGQAPNSTWALRSEVNAAGDGGVMCSACVPSVASGQGEGSRMLITGGKDSVLREWEVAEGRPRMVAQISGHTDWISCCALMPSTTAGCPPSACASGGRDGSVRFWSKSAAAAAALSQPRGNQGAKGDKTSLLRAAFASGSRSTSGRGGGFVGGGGGGGSAASLGDGGWSLSACMAAAHGSSEFVTCCASPGGSSGAIGGWVATGGTDWSVRLWDVAKSRELGRLSFMGHSHSVRSLACSSDGNLLVSGGDDHKVIVWSPQSRRPLATLKGHASAVHGLAIDPGTHSGNPPRWVASGGGEGFLLVWDPRNWGSPVATLRGEAGVSAAPASSSHPLADALSSKASIVEGAEGSLKGGLAGARLRGESGRWEGETTGATMLNSVNCLAAGGAGGSGDWLFAAGETVVRSWQGRDGVWHGGAGLPGEGLGGVASLSVVE